MKEIFDDIKNTLWKDERVLEYEQIAKEYGFQFTPRARFAEQPYSLKGLQLFKGKKGKRLSGILTKEKGSGASTTRIYDYIYYRESKTRTSTVFEFYIPQIALSKLLIRPKRRTTKLKSFFVRENPIFPGLDNFNKNYEILSANTSDLKYELNEEFLALLSNQEKIWVEGEKNYLLFYYKNKAIPIRKIRAHYEITLDLLDSLLNGRSSQEYV